MKIWKAHYQDAFHDTMIDILNTEEDSRTEPLSFTLDGVKFEGSSLEDFGLADDQQYDEAKEKFCLLKSGGYLLEDGEILYFYGLQRYALDVEIPVKVIRKRDQLEMQGMIHIAFHYTENNGQENQIRVFCDDVRIYPDDLNVSDFTLYIDGKHYSGTQWAEELEFESSLYSICHQMEQEYYMQCCFTCQYSDYSPYGNNSYGDMLYCCRHKEGYLKVNEKSELLEYLEGKEKDITLRQETYLCQKYAPRNQCEGYRDLYMESKKSPQHNAEGIFIRHHRKRKLFLHQGQDLRGRN